MIPQPREFLLGNVHALLNRHGGAVIPHILCAATVAPAPTRSAPCVGYGEWDPLVLGLLPERPALAARVVELDSLATVIPNTVGIPVFLRFRSAATSGDMRPLATSGAQSPIGPPRPPDLFRAAYRGVSGRIACGT